MVSKIVYASSSEYAVISTKCTFVNNQSIKYGRTFQRYSSGMHSGK
jgi:hypothetical protein